MDAMISGSQACNTCKTTVCRGRPALMRPPPMTPPCGIGGSENGGGGSAVLKKERERERERERQLLKDALMMWC